MGVRVFAWQAWKASRRPIRKAAQRVGDGKPAVSGHGVILWITLWETDWQLR